ncbi:crotonase/enoyl-CoA hydratase family protein [Pararhodobacter sp. SW119]|uniref:crotonase/enoyl-CoA hydratase family protein n=1 Tax=Pararhodobacter sp. SW119 TaxID=2780075 RepID=UPI001AE0203F|nr:crotonase/enoyl-CoA hydratase family protein [Pararhodobacter sp. SW119]
MSTEAIPRDALSHDRLRVRVAGGVAEVALNRPDKLNAMDEAMFDALSAAGRALMGTVGLRAVILHGLGRGFCAGIDTGLLMALAGRIGALRDEIVTPLPGEAANRFQHPCTVWADLPVPVIAALHGPVFGAGLQLALGADIRLAAPDAQLSIMEAKWGLVPDMGITRLMPGILRADQALELMLTARVLGAAEAASLGLVTRIAEDPMDAARSLARVIAARNPAAVSGMKSMVRSAWPGDEAHLALEARLQAGIIGTPEQIEAVTATMQNRAPRFG